MALTDVNGFPLKFEARIDTKKAETDAKRLKDLFKNMSIDTKPASKALEAITKESTKAVTVTKDLKSAFDHLTGSAGSVHTNIAKARAETQSLAQTERDLRKALKEKLITDDEYIKKLSLVSKRRTELNDKLREYRAELKKAQVQEKSFSRPDVKDNDWVVDNASTRGESAIIVKNAAEWEKERAAVEEAYLASRKANEAIKETTESLTKQDDVLKKVSSSEEERVSILETLKINLKEYKHLAEGATDPKTLKGYNAEIQSIEKEIKQMSNVGKVGFDDMGNAIKKTDVQSEGLVRNLSRGVEQLRRFAYIVPGLGIAGLVSMAIKPISEYIKSLGKVKKAVSESFLDSGYKDAIKNVTQLKNNIDLANKGIVSKDKVVRDYNKTIGKTAGELKNFGGVEKWIVDQSDAYIQAVKMRMEAQALLNLSIDQTVEAQKRMFEGGTWKQKAAAGLGAAFSGGDVVAGYQTILRQITQEELASLADVSDSALEAYEKLLKKSEEFNKKHGFDFDKIDNSKEYQSAQKLLQRIADLRAEYSRKVMSSDEEEVQAVRDKFKKIANEVKLFNANPKNKIKVSIGDLNEIRDTAIEDLRFKQETVRLKVEIEKQKEIFQEFEDFKLQTSERYASLRYGAEMAEFDTFEKFLEKHQKELYDTAQKRDLSRGEVDRLKYVNEQLDAFRKDERVKEAQRFLTAYEAAKTHNQNLEEIDAEHYRNIASLAENATIEQLNNLDRLRQKRISDEVAANLKIQTNWEETFVRFGQMSNKAVNKYLDDVEKRYKAELAAGKLTVVQYKALMDELTGVRSSNSNPFAGTIKGFKEWKKAVKEFGADSEQAKGEFKVFADQIAQDAEKVNSVLGSLSNSFKQLGIGDENLDKSLDNIMGMVDGIGKLSEGIATKNPIAIITGSVGLLTNVIDLFNTKDKKLQKQIDGYQKQLDALGKAYKQLERDISNSVGESFYDDTAKAISNINGQIGETQKILEAERKKKKPDQNKIKEYENQIEDLGFQVEDLQRSISEMLLQSDFKAFSSNLASALLSAFEAGEDGIDAMDDAYKKFIKNAISNSAMLKFIQPIIDDMMRSATDYASKNDNSLLGFGFEEWSEKINKAGTNFMDYISGAFESFGIDRELGKSGIKGAFERTVTESTANEWIGLGRATYDLEKRAFEVNVSAKEILNRSDNTLVLQLNSMNSQLAVLNKIQTNTSNTVDRLDLAVDQLEIIALNTRVNQGQSDRDLGI